MKIPTEKSPLSIHSTMQLDTNIPKPIYMKKSAWIILTIVASLTLGGCANQSLPQNIETPYSIVDEEVLSDTTRYNLMQPQPVYDYYYQSRFWDGLFRLFRPHYYHKLISQKGFTPHYKRTDRSQASNHTLPGPVSHHHSRGGFGHTGTHHTVVG